MAPGIYSIHDLEAVTNSSAASFGMNKIFDAIAQQLASDNATMSELRSDLCQPVSTQLAKWGGTTLGGMTKVDEYGEALPQKFKPGLTAGFPLDKFSYRLGWTWEYMQLATPAEIAKTYNEMMDAFYRQNILEIQRALFLSTAYTFTDHFTDEVSYTVYRLWDNDGTFTPPPSPHGVAFANTHDHYNGDAVLAQADILANIVHLEEHGNTKGVKICVNIADKAVFATAANVGSTTFIPLTPAFIVDTTWGSAETSKKYSLETVDLENQHIGNMVTGEEVWVKPWVPLHYYCYVATGMPDKVLGFRERPGASGLRIIGKDPDYPFLSDTGNAYFGYGVWNRGMAVIGYDQNDTWADPTIAD